MTATFPLAPTTRHPEKACPLENNVNPPAGTTGNSKPPFLVRLAAADAVVADPVVADAVPQLAINTPTDSAAQATPWEMNARMTRPPLSCASIPGGISSCQAPYRQSLIVYSAACSHPRNVSTSRATSPTGR